MIPGWSGLISTPGCIVAGMPLLPCLVGWCSHPVCSDATLEYHALPWDISVCTEYIISYRIPYLMAKHQPVKVFQLCWVKRMVTHWNILIGVPVKLCNPYRQLEFFPELIYMIFDCLYILADGHLENEIFFGDKLQNIPLFKKLYIIIANNK